MTRIGPGRRRRPAFTLIEMCAVFVLLGVLSLAGMATLLAAVRVQRSAMSLTERATAQGALADLFRADVTHAVVAPDRLGDERASPACLLLRRADGREIAWRWADGRLTRFEGAGASRRTQSPNLGGAHVQPEFARAGRMIALRLWEHRGAAARRCRAEVTAVLGSDRP